MPKKGSDGLWHVDIRPYGANGPRLRRKFKTKAEALRFEAHTINKAKDAPWEPEKKDTRTLTELIELWTEVHGRHVKSGQVRKKPLQDFAAFTGNKQGRLVKPVDFLQFRAARIDAGYSPTSLNTYLLYAKGMFNKLIKLELIDYKNPLRHVEPIKLQEKERTFLTAEEIHQLLERLVRDDFDVFMLALVCLSTGARWSEAENLTVNDVIENRVRFKETKSRKIREVPVSEVLAAQLVEWIPKKVSKSARFTFKVLLAKYGLKKSEYQSTHILRHSFGAHFIMNGGNLVTLQKIMGHSDIHTTMIYAHLSPTHLIDAVRLNPVNVDAKWTQEKAS